ncbi:putative HAD-like protein [Phytophthora infestans]|uniref:Putative HAD-like protein n=1 Tax=Phytophthora infestans TaxID=4787 RepID=A0A833X2E2_PHYIN|nr:putative HAD-like protein [Phytophthora infestans]
MSLDGATSRRPVLLCVDFDETITLRDTTSLLFQLASSTASMQQQLVTQYVDEVGEFLSRYKTKWQQRGNNPNSSFDGAGLREFLGGYAAVDLRSVHRVVKSRVLKGIRLQDLVNATSSVQIRPNCVDTLALADVWKIISVNWNKSLLESVMSRAGAAHDPTQIIANEMKTDQQGVTTGEIDVKVQSPMDKAWWIDKIRSMYSATQPTVVYVGDSVTDLLALLAADVGIWIAPDETGSNSAKLFRELVDHYGINIHPLMNCTSLGDCVAYAKPVLYTATDWAEINAILSAAPNRIVTSRTST